MLVDGRCFIRRRRDPIVALVLASRMILWSNLCTWSHTCYGHIERTLWASYRHRLHARQWLYSQFNQWYTQRAGSPKAQQPSNRVIKRGWSTWITRNRRSRSGYDVAMQLPAISNYGCHMIGLTVISNQSVITVWLSQLVHSSYTYNTHYVREWLRDVHPGQTFLTDLHCTSRWSVMCKTSIFLRDLNE